MSDRPGMTRRQLREAKHNGQSMADAHTDAHADLEQAQPAQSVNSSAPEELAQPTRSTPIVDAEGHVSGGAGMTRRELRLLRAAAAKKLEQGEDAAQVASELTADQDEIFKDVASETDASANVTPSDNQPDKAKVAKPAVEPSAPKAETAESDAADIAEKDNGGAKAPVAAEQAETKVVPVVSQTPAKEQLSGASAPLLPDEAAPAQAQAGESNSSVAEASADKPEPTKKKRWWAFGGRKAEATKQADEATKKTAETTTESAGTDKDKAAGTSASAAEQAPLLPTPTNGTGPIVSGALLGSGSQSEEPVAKAVVASDHEAKVETTDTESVAVQAAESRASAQVVENPVEVGSATDPKSPATPTPIAPAPVQEAETKPAPKDVFQQSTVAIDLPDVLKDATPKQDSSNAFVKPETDLLAAPLHKTGEVILSTGTITLPDSMSQTGRLALQFDPSEVPAGHDNGDFSTAEIKPVSARDAVESLDGNTVIPTQVGTSNGITIALAIVAGVLLIAAAGVLVANLLVHNGGM